MPIGFPDDAHGANAVIGRGCGGQGAQPPYRRRRRSKRQLFIRHLSDRDDPALANLGRESRPIRFCMALVDEKTGIWYNAHEQARTGSLLES